MARSPKASGGGKVRTPSLKAVQPIQCQPPAWQWKWKQSGTLDCLKRWQSDHTSHHPHRLNELATKSQMWNEKPAIVQELCESPGGHPGLSVLTSLMVSVDVKLYWPLLCSRIGLSLSLICQPTSKDIKQHRKDGRILCYFHFFSTENLTEHKDRWKNREGKERKKNVDLKLSADS